MATHDFQRYLQARSAFAPTFSPDGTRLAFLTDLTGVPQVWSVAVESGWPDQLTFFAERVSSVQYAPQADELLFAMDTGGNERHALYLLRRDGAEVIPVTAAAESIHQFGGWSRDGRQIVYAANTRHQAYFDLYVDDPAAPAPRRVLEHDGTTYAIGWTADGRIIAARQFTNLHNALLLVDPAAPGDEPRLLTPDPAEAEYSWVQATADGRGLYLVSDLHRDFLTLQYLDLASLTMSVIDAPEWDIEEVALSRDGRYLAYTVNIDGYSELRLRDTASGERRLLPALPPATYSGLAFSPDGRRLALTLNGARDNADLWMLDHDAGRAWQVTRSGRGGIPREDLVEPQVIRYPSFDGRQIPALYFQPAESARAATGLPVLVEVHGGPEGQRRPIWSATTQYLIGRGYGVLAPNVRGSTGYGKAYTHLDDVHLRMDSVRDLAHAVTWLRANGADPARIGVMGGSYGGFMVLSAITTYPDLWAAAVDIVGIANFVTFLENTGSWRRALREAEYGSLEHDRDFLESISPIHHVERITAPLLVIHGANDPRVPVDEAEQIVSTLRALNRPVEYLRFEDEGHGLVKLANRITGYTAIGAFLDRWLHGAP